MWWQGEGSRWQRLCGGGEGRKTLMMAQVVKGEGAGQGLRLRFRFSEEEREEEEE